MAVMIHYDGSNQFVVGNVTFKKSMEPALVTEKREVYSFPFGNAEVVELTFSDIYIVYGDMLLYEQKRIDFELIDSDDLVEMHFTLGGEGRLVNQVTGKPYFFKVNEHNLHYTPAFRGSGVYEGEIKKIKQATHH